MSTGNNVLQVRVDQNMHEAVIADIERRNAHARGATWGVSEWLRAAIAEKLAKGIRSRKGCWNSRYKCSVCGKRVTLSEISYLIKPLFGPNEYTCTNCVTVNLNGD